MKYIFLITVLVASIFANSLQWLDSMDKAFIEAKKRNKPIMVFVEAKHCPWCEKMLYQTLEEKDTVKVLNRDYVLVKLDIDSKDGRKYFPSTSITPTTYFISPNKKPLIALEGFEEESIFYMHLSDVDKALKDLGKK